MYSLLEPAPLLPKRSQESAAFEAQQVDRNHTGVGCWVSDSKVRPRNWAPEQDRRGGGQQGSHSPAGPVLSYRELTLHILTYNKPFKYCKIEA